MAAKYIHKFPTTAALLAAAADRTLALGLGAVSNIVYHNVSGVAVAVLDESTAQTATNKTFTSPAINTPTITGGTLGFGTKSNAGGDTSTPNGLASGLSDITANASGSVQSTEYTLNSITIKANSFNAATRSIVVEAWGTLAANANAKNLKIYFGATAIATITGSTANGKDFYICLTVVRTGASTQSAVGTIQIDTAVAPTMAVNGAVAETDTADIVIAVKSANTAAAATSATGKGMAAVFTN